VLTKNDHFLKSLVADGIAYEWFRTCLDFLEEEEEEEIPEVCRVH
jgi:hypothetical protein